MGRRSGAKQSKKTVANEEFYIMKIVALIARVLLGLMFVVFGLNGFLHFIHQPPPDRAWHSNT